ncbi:MAG TPA: hypothetical protein VF756_02790 [Thermoanaerobaculia bacterium]
MPEKLRCLLLCEDAEQEWLFRPILKNLFHRVRVEPRIPNGGFTFVLARLADAAKYLRQRPKEAVGLLVVIDGDKDGYQRRLDKIQEVLRTAGLDLKSSDRIATCIPTRNVETWELWLCGYRDLDETSDYKSRFHREVKPRVHRSQLIDAWFARLSDEQREQEAAQLPALAKGRTEIQALARSH